MSSRASFNISVGSVAFTLILVLSMLQSAIPAAADPDVIEVEPGEYTATWNFTTKADYTLNHTVIQGEQVTLESNKSVWEQTSQGDFNAGSTNMVVVEADGTVILDKISGVLDHEVEDFIALDEWDITYSDGGGDSVTPQGTNVHDTDGKSAKVDYDFSQASGSEDIRLKQAFPSSQDYSDYDSLRLWVYCDSNQIRVTLTITSNTPTAQIYGRDITCGTPGWSQLEVLMDDATTGGLNINAVDEINIWLKETGSSSGASGTIYLDELSLTGGEGYTTSGQFTSEIFNAGSGAAWLIIGWEEDLPPTTDIYLQTRSGPNPSVGPSWSAWSSELTFNTGIGITSPFNQYFQYMATLTSTDPRDTPVLSSVSVEHGTYAPWGTVTTFPFWPENLQSWGQFFMTSNANGGDIVVMYSEDGGSNWLGMPSGNDMSTVSPGSELVFMLDLASAGDGNSPVVFSMSLDYLAGEGPVLMKPIKDVEFLEDTIKVDAFDLDSHFKMIGSGTLSYSFEGNDKIGVEIDDDARVDFGTTEANWSGYENITFKASDGQGHVAWDEITVTVTEVNDPPYFTSQPVTVGAIGEKYTYDVEAVDAEGHNITYSLSMKPEGMTIDKKTGLIEWTPTIEQTGEIDVTVALDDGWIPYIIVQPFKIVVPAPNEPPTAVIQGPPDAKVGQKVTFDGTGSTDSDGNVTSYLWDLGDGTTSTDPVVEHKYKKSKTYTVNLTVTDDDGESSYRLVAIVVRKKADDGFPGFTAIILIAAILAGLALARMPGRRSRG
jgi:hypothetical protein